MFTNWFFRTMSADLFQRFDKCFTMHQQYRADTGRKFWWELNFSMMAHNNWILKLANYVNSNCYWNLWNGNTTILSQVAKVNYMNIFILWIVYIDRRWPVPAVVALWCIIVELTQLLSGSMASPFSITASKGSSLKRLSLIILSL